MDSRNGDDVPDAGACRRQIVHDTSMGVGTGGDAHSSI
jgi:hypothetical protein